MKKTNFAMKLAMKEFEDQREEIKKKMAMLGQFQEYFNFSVKQNVISSNGDIIQRPRNPFPIKIDQL